MFQRWLSLAAYSQLSQDKGARFIVGIWKQVQGLRANGILPADRHLENPDMLF